jgi:hypothetical protein
MINHCQTLLKKKHQSRRGTRVKKKGSTSKKKQHPKIQLYKERLQKETIGTSQRVQKSHNPLTKLHEVNQTRNGVGNTIEHQAWKRPPSQQWFISRWRWLQHL